MKNKFLIGLCGCLLVAGLSSCGPKKWKVTFDSNGGSEVTTQEVKDGAKATKPTDPTKDGCNFESWYTTEDLSGDAYNFDTAVKADLKLYAKWADKVVPTGFTFVDDVDDATINVGATGTAKIKLNSDVDASKVNIKWTIEDTTILEKVGNDNELEFKFKGLKATDLLGTKIAVSVTSKDIVSYHSEKGFNVFVETPATKVDVSKEQAYSYVTTYTLKSNTRYEFVTPEMTDCQLKIFCLFNGDPEWYLKFTDYIDSSTTVLKYNGNKVTTAGIKEVVLGYGTRDYLDFNKDDSSYFITSGILSLTFTTKNFGADKTISKIGFSVGIL